MPRSVAVPDKPINAIQIPTLSLPNAFQVELIDSAEALQYLAPEWAALWREISATPFQSPQWLIPFLRSFPVKNLRVLAMRHRSQLVALAPFHISEDEATGLRKLLLLGSGVSDYLDLLVQPRYEEVFLPFIRQMLAGHRHEWDQCDFIQLPPESLLRRVASSTPGTPCPCVSLLGKSNLDFAPSRQLEKLRYYRRRAEKLGRFEFFRADATNSDSIMQDLFALHSARWNGLHQEGVLNDILLRDFHLEVASRMAHSGILRLYSAQLDGITIAAL